MIGKLDGTLKTMKTSTNKTKIKGVHTLDWTA